jgi:hypothetical protein
MIHTFTVNYITESGDESQMDIPFDTTDYDAEDFMGGAGQEAIEDIFAQRCPTAEWLCLELPDTLEHA